MELELTYPRIDSEFNLRLDVKFVGLGVNIPGMDANNSGSEDRSVLIIFFLRERYLWSLCLCVLSTLYVGCLFYGVVWLKQLIQKVHFT